MEGLYVYLNTHKPPKNNKLWVHPNVSVEMILGAFGDYPIESAKYGWVFDGIWRCRPTFAPAMLYV